MDTTERDELLIRMDERQITMHEQLDEIVPEVRKNSTFRKFIIWAGIATSTVFGFIVTLLSLLG